jgi:hypothetical protein
MIHRGCKEDEIRGKSSSLKEGRKARGRSTSVTVLFHFPWRVKEINGYGGYAGNAGTEAFNDAFARILLRLSMHRV